MSDGKPIFRVRTSPEEPEEPGEDTEARRRWSERMRTDPLFRRRKLVHWQWQIDYAAKRGWPAPEHAVGGLEFYGRVHDQWQRERQLGNPEGWQRENAQVEAAVAEWKANYVARQTETEARLEAQRRAIEADRRRRPPTGRVTPDTGKLEGRRPSEYVGEVRALLRKKHDGEAETLLLRLLDVLEDESEATGLGVAPWFYERLAILYSKRHDHAAEVEVLERFARQRHAPGVVPPRLLHRLEKARGRLG